MEKDELVVTLKEELKECQEKLRVKKRRKRETEGFGCGKFADGKQRERK